MEENAKHDEQPTPEQQPRLQFVVDRSKWYRGRGSDYSRLVLADGRKCCVGFFGEQCLGLTENRMREQPALSDLYSVVVIDGVRFDKGISPDRDVLREWQEKIRREYIYSLNDNQLISDEGRERKLIEQFARIGVDVRFVN